MKSQRWLIGPLMLEALQETQYGRLQYRLTEPLTISSTGDRHGVLTMQIVIPKDFVTDLASVPRVWWRVFPPAGTYAAAAVVHDWFYQHPQGVSRFLADAIFRDLMDAMQVPWWKRWFMWAAVRLNSWRYWHEDMEDITP
ncbi:MAG: hypothetical protein A2W31_15260 [Planctomycetes bacterium RBG_16_64_10]|nr:MAG: hypothetical protein A2W31_15260 [Planctomycetes bacterium RBG_16_64_10]